LATRLTLKGDMRIHFAIALASMYNLSNLIQSV